MTKTFKKISLIVWAIIAIIFVLTFLTPLEFADEMTSSIMTVLAISGLTLVLWLLTTDKDKKKKWRAWTLILLPLTIFTIIITDFFSWGSGYKTQDIIYRQKGNTDNRIEYQMEDIGALGYNRRTVKIIQLTPLLQWITTTDTDDIDTNVWTKVDEYVNELGLKGG